MSVLKNEITVVIDERNIERYEEPEQPDLRILNFSQIAAYRLNQHRESRSRILKNYILSTEPYVLAGP